MAYIGRGVDKISNIEVLDAITFTNSAGPYNLLKDTVAFTPTSPNALVISIDGVIQSPDSYTIASATITFDTSMSSASTNDFIYQMGVGILTAPSDGSVTAARLATDAVETAKIKDLNVTAGKLATTQDLSTKTITLPATVAGLGTGIDVTSQITGVVPTANLGSGSASSTTILYGDQTYKTEPAEYDDSVLQSNIAMLGFKVAVNGSLTRYNLVDQSIDEFFDTSGVDASASTNEARSGSSPYYYYGETTVTPTITEDADDSGVDGDYTWYKWTATGATGSYETNTTQDHDFLVIAGGGSGGTGNSAAGGGGAGGYRNSWASEASGGGGSSESAVSFVGGTTYTITIGTGGAPATGSIMIGNDGVASSIAGSDITDITTVGGGGGGKPASGGSGRLGGSGGGGAGPLGGYLGGAGTANQGDAGGSANDSHWSGAGGGGSGAVGITITATGNNQSTAGGAGLSSSIDGSATYRGGGGGGCGDAPSVVSQAGGIGGGGAGSVSSAVAGTANTGGGGGAGSDSGAGGTGIVILRRLTSAEGGGGNLTLQSTDVTAESTPTYGEFVTLIENAAGTATLNTDIKGYVSRDSGTTFTQGTLVDEGTWGTNKQILGFHDLDISAQPSGVAMCYKIETLNQSASSKETRIYATSIGWR